MTKQLKIIALLLAASVASTWALYHLNQEASVLAAIGLHAPDYYMDDFTTLSMNENGRPDYKLDAIYLAHYPENDTTEILQPNIELYRSGKPALTVSADKGWLAADNEVVLLTGNVVFSETDASGAIVMRISTDKARLLINQNYAETDQPASIRTGRTTITGTGMQANFNAGKLTVLNDVHTIIAAK